MDRSERSVCLLGLFALFGLPLVVFLLAVRPFRVWLRFVLDDGDADVLVNVAKACPPNLTGADVSVLCADAYSIAQRQHIAKLHELADALQVSNTDIGCPKSVERLFGLGPTHILRLSYLILRQAQKWALVRALTFKSRFRQNKPCCSSSMPMNARSTLRGLPPSSRESLSGDHQHASAVPGHPGGTPRHADDKELSQ